MPYSAFVKSIPKFTGPNESIKAIPHARALESLGSNFPIKNFGGATATTDFRSNYYRSILVLVYLYIHNNNGLLVCKQ